MLSHVSSSIMSDGRGAGFGALPKSLRTRTVRLDRKSVSGRGLGMAHRIKEVARIAKTASPRLAGSAVRRRNLGHSHP